MADTASTTADATLELTFLSTDGLKNSNPIQKSRFLAVVWVDPALKKSAKTPLTPALNSTPQTLHLPLPPQTLLNPTSSLTVQILSPHIPFRKLIATGRLPLSSIPFAADVLTLPLQRPSGRPQGSLRVAVRILWCIGAPPPAIRPADAEQLDFLSVAPTAPPMQEWQCEASTEVLPAYPTGPPMADDPRYLSDDSLHAGVEEVESPTCVLQPDPTVMKGRSAWRNFLLGFVGGTVATVLMAVAGLPED